MASFTTNEYPYTEGKVQETPETAYKVKTFLKVVETPQKLGKPGEYEEEKVPETPRTTRKKFKAYKEQTQTTTTMDVDKNENIETTTEPFQISQEYAEIKEEDVNFLMEKMKAYLYYPKDEADFIRHIEKYDKKYREDLAKWMEKINDIVIKEDRKMGSGGGKEMHGGDFLKPKELEKLALLAIEYKRTILSYGDTNDIIELNKKTIGLTLIRINNTGHTEHNVLVQVPIECFNFNKTERIQVGASRFEYGILSTKHVYYFDQTKQFGELGQLTYLENWLKNQSYTYPQLGTWEQSAKKISNIVFRNNIVEYEVTKKSILGNEKRINAFNERLTPDKKKFLTENKKHFETLLLKTKNVDKVFVSLRFHPGNRGRIIYTIKQFFKNMSVPDPDDSDKPIIHKGEQVLDRYGVFQKKDGKFIIKDVFKELGIFYDTTNTRLEKLDIDLRNGNFGQDAEANQTKKEDLGKQIGEINGKIEEIHRLVNSNPNTRDGHEGAQIDDLESEREKLIDEFKELDKLGNTVDEIKGTIKQLIMPGDSEPPYTGLWFNLTIPGNHTWILFYVNKQFYSIGGGYNNDREYKLAFYSPDPVFDYENHWLFPLMMNNWGFIDQKIIDNLKDMAKSIENRTSEGFVTTNLKYSLLSNRLSALCGYYNCASTADKILGQSIPMTFSHPSFSRGGEYTYTSQIFEALNIDSKVELVLSATQRFQHYNYKPAMELDT